MAFSYAKYLADGVNRTFNVPFNYLDRSHVSVKVDGAKKSFAWLTSNSIRLNQTPEAGSQVVIRRSTPNVSPLVDFVDGATITERDLDLLAYQNIYLNQEAADMAAEVEEGLGDAKTTILASVNQALAAVSSAETLAEEAYNRAASAENFVTNTASQVNLDKVAAQSAATDAASSKTAASASATAAATSATQAATAKTQAEAARNTAQYYAGIATAIGEFDAGNYYTKVQVDGLLDTSSFDLTQITGLDTALAGKADAGHTHTISNITNLQSTLDGKLGVTATAAAASKLATARTITLTGDVSGSASFDGSANVSITATVEDDSHNHIIANVDGLQTALDAKATLSHTHSISNITNLQATLDGKAAASHTHTIAQISGLQSALDAVGGSLKVDLFDASGSWTCPAGVTSVIALVVAGGGGSHRYANGGGGGWALTQFNTTPGSVYTVTVGAGGNGRENSSNAYAGGASSIALGETILASATGGSGGKYGTENPAASGVGTVGNINLASGLAMPPLLSGVDRGNGAIGAIAWSTSSTFRPGAAGTPKIDPGPREASGGVGGAVLILYGG